MYIENHMVKEEGRQTDIFFCFPFCFFLPMCWTKIWNLCQIFWLFIIRANAPLSAPNNCNLAALLTCFCGYSQSKNIFPISLQILHLFGLTVCRCLLLGTVTCLFREVLRWNFSAANKYYFSADHHEQKNKKTTSQMKFSVVTIKQQINLVLRHSLCK